MDSVMTCWKKAFEIETFMQFKKVDAFGLHGLPPERIDNRSWYLKVPLGYELMLRPGDRAIIPIGLKFNFANDFVGMVTHISEMFVEIGVRVDNFHLQGMTDNVNLVVRNVGSVNFKIMGGEDIAILYLLKLQYDYVGCLEVVKFGCEE
jgi:dUTPase